MNGFRVCHRHANKHTAAVRIWSLGRENHISDASYDDRDKLTSGGCVMESLDHCLAFPFFTKKKTQKNKTAEQAEGTSDANTHKLNLAGPGMLLRL